jgi:hypothetical protein
MTAAMTLTATDFIDGGLRKDAKSRNYKVLQSMDLRRFGEQLDKGETVACMAGSMDLIHGPFPDHSGELLRANPHLKGWLNLESRPEWFRSDQRLYIVQRTQSCPCASLILP